MFGAPAIDGDLLHRTMHNATESGANGVPFCAGALRARHCHIRHCLMRTCLVRISAAPKSIQLNTTMTSVDQGGKA
jgi:hypothetical protein